MKRTSSDVLFLLKGEGMGFRVVLVENEVEMRLKLDNLVVRKLEKEIWIPLEDISIMILDNMKVTITARMLCALAKHNVGMMVCNQEHLPIGFYCSYDNHSRISKNMKYQIDVEDDFYDALWSKIIARKIVNQKNVLQQLNKENKSVLLLEQFVRELGPGDKTNREAHAAKVYFNTLMGCSFSRGNEEILLNSGLDFGYAVLRSFIAKMCVGYGLNSQLGIHHCNEYNRFNLVDDLIEPFRPFVDLYAYQLLNEEDYFTSEHRRKLANMLNHRIVYKGRNMYLCNAIEEYVSGYAALLKKKTNWELPDVSEYQGEEDEI